MIIAYYLLPILTVIQRLGELVYARQTRKLLKQQGFQQSERPARYSQMVSVHTAWFLGMLIEPWMVSWPITPPLAYFALATFLAAQLGRFWVLFSLGRHWNTQVMSNSQSDFVQHGPYRWIRHPNYLVVILEIASLPLIGGAYITAVAVSSLNAVVLFRRIEHEDTMLLHRPGYREYAAKVPRLIPLFFARLVVFNR